jgi:tetratricopeptide (TPR) repeat protein
VDQAVLEKPDAIDRRMIQAFLFFFSGHAEAARREFDIVGNARPDLAALQPFRVHFAEQTADSGLSRFEIAFIFFRLRIYDRSSTIFLSEVAAKPTDSRAYPWAALAAIAMDAGRVERVDQAHVLLRRLATADGLRLPLDPPIADAFVDQDGQPDAQRLNEFVNSVRDTVAPKASPARLAFVAWLEFAAGNKRAGFAALDTCEAPGATVDPLAKALRTLVGATPPKAGDGDGDALFREGKYEAAAEAYFKIYELDASNPANGLMMARAMCALDMFDRAADLIRSALPDDQQKLNDIPAAIAGWRSYFAESSKLDALLARFRSKCDDWPDRMDLYESYGIVLFLAGRAADARTVFEALKDEPRAGRSRIKFYLKRIADGEVPAGPGATPAPSVSPDDELAYVTVVRARAAAYVLFGDRKYDDAERLLMKAVAKHSSASDVWALDLALAHVQLARGQYARGEAFLRRALSAYPRLAGIADDRECRWDTRYSDEFAAKEHLADLYQAVRTRPNDDKQRYLLAGAYFLFGKYKEAGDEFDRLRRVLEGDRKPVPPEINTLLDVARQKAKP